MTPAANILFINPDSRRYAGSNVSLLGILDGLDRHRFEPIVAMPANGEFGKQLAQRNIEILEFDLNGWWFPTLGHFHRMLSGLHGRVEVLTKFIRQRDVRLVYTNVEYAFEGALAATMTAVPHVWCMRPPFTHDLDILKHFPLSPAALGQAMNDLSNVIAVDCVRQLVSFPESVPQEKLRVIESGLDIPSALKSKDTARRELTALLGIPASSRIVLNVSRMSPEKDLDTFVHAAKVVIHDNGNDVHFVHLGSPTAAEYAAKIHGLVEDLGLRSRVHHVDETDRIYDIMRAADVFLFTSVNYEGLVRVCAEAMLAEVPVVSTRCGGPEDYVIEGQTGYLTEVADVRALAAHTSYLLAHPEEARAMGVRARNLIVSKYDNHRMNGLWMDLFDELLAHPQPPAINALTLELLVNTLTLLGETGALASQQNSRLRTIEGWLVPLNNNAAMRALHRVKALAKKAIR